MEVSFNEDQSNLFLSLSYSGLLFWRKPRLHDALPTLRQVAKELVAGRQEKTSC
jgi:hypothetical protein